jgi:nitrogen-specific signal transduction histidine kinase
MKSTMKKPRCWICQGHARFNRTEDDGGTASSGSEDGGAIGQLTGGIAHDFNNLLTVISGNIETVQRRMSRTDPGLYRYLEAAARAVERASTLTHRLLAYSRRQPLEPRSVELNRLIMGMSDLLGRTIGAHITIETVLAGGLWQVSADPNQVENAILNLAVNARDAMPDGGKLTLETANTYLDEAYARINAEVTPGQYAMLAVSDTGIGMTPDVVEKAFEPFFTTKGLGEGTGLGLSQVYGFIKQSGGHIKIYSELGEGTTVRLYLPRLRERPPVVHEDALVAQPSPLGGQETILVVEDDDEVRAYTTDILRELGYEILEATEGDTALSLIATFRRKKRVSGRNRAGGLNGSSRPVVAGGVVELPRCEAAARIRTQPAWPWRGRY